MAENSLKNQRFEATFKNKGGKRGSSMRKSLAIVLFLALLIIPCFAGVVNYSAPSEKEIGQVYIFTANVQDGGGSPVNNSPCQVYVSAPNGEIVNYFKPDTDTKTLYTDGAGNLVYGFKIVSSIYQVDNIYNVTILCPSGSVMQPFMTISPPTPNWFFNFLFFLKDNASFIVLAIILLFLLQMALRKMVGDKWANSILAIGIVAILIGIIYAWVFG